MKEVEKVDAQSKELADIALEAMRAKTGDEITQADLVAVVMAASRVLASVLYATTKEAPDMYPILLKVSAQIVAQHAQEPTL